MIEETFQGLDFELIDLIYFREKEKSNYIKQVSNAIKELEITTSSSRIETLNKIVEYDTEIPFIRDLLLFTFDQPFTQKTLLNKYYILCNLCQFNLTEKLNAKFHDFKLEESLLDEILKCDLYNYAKIKTLFSFGYAFSLIDLSEKRDFFFNLLDNQTYELSPNTVTTFYKQISDIYLSISDNKAALEWLKKGLRVNPNFSVKRKIKQLEAEIDSPPK